MMTAERILSVVIAAIGIAAVAAIDYTLITQGAIFRPHDPLGSAIVGAVALVPTGVVVSYSAYLIWGLFRP